MSARISKMYKDSGGCKVGKTCGECRYFANSGIKNEYVCKRQVSDDLWDGKWPACKFFEDRGDEPMEVIATEMEQKEPKNELVINGTQLPDNIPDLSKFVLIGREKLTAVRAEIRAITKVGLAKEVHQQKIREAQDLAEAVLDAEVRIGELLKDVPKATKGTGSNQYKKAKNRTDTNFSKTKSEQLAELNISKDQASNYQTLASHPEAVEKAKEEARTNGEVVTRSAALKKIKDKKSVSKPQHNHDAVSDRDIKEQKENERENAERKSNERKKHMEAFYNNIIANLISAHRNLRFIASELRCGKYNLSDADSFFNSKEGGVKKIISELKEAVVELEKLRR